MSHLSRAVKAFLVSEISPRKYYAQSKEKIPHILLGGSLDALTTLIAISVFSLGELNPLVNHLMIENTYAIPFVLMELAFLRYLVVYSAFRTTKYLNFAIYFTLYFLPIWNVANMFYKVII